MKLLLQQVSSTALLDIFPVVSKVIGSTPGIELVTRSTRPWKCFQCRHQSTNVRARRKLGLGKTDAIARHGLPTTSRLTSSTVRRAFSAYTTPQYPIGERDASTSTTTELPSQEEGRRSHISRRFTHLMDHLQSNIFIAGQRLNDLTGYSGIEALKKEIEEQGAAIRHDSPTNS